MSFHKDLRSKDLHAPSTELVENNTGSTITKMTVVDLNGMGTVYPQVAVGNPALFPSFGIAQDDILSGSFGYITCLGFMFEIDTSLWPTSTVLYSSPTGNLQSVVNGAPVAVVVKQDATYGVMYVSADLADQAIAETNWQLNGNPGTDPSTQFIGTTDNNPVKFRTNNIPVGQFDAQGRFGIGPDSPERPFHLKPYTGYTHSGLQIESFAITTNNSSLDSIYTVNFLNNQVIKVKFQVTGRQSDGTVRCSFTRSALFYKENANVQIEGKTWQSDFTSSSNGQFSVNYTMGTNTVDFKIKNSTGSTTYWSGHVEVEIVSQS